jgi:hypothetical protein
MTAEIAIMNRQAIVLAADSAVTVGRRKVWKTANKLFSLSPHNDIAIMAYGAGDFVGFPWETIVKSFRLLVGKKRYKTVQECADEFIEYLKKPLFTADLEEQVSVMVGFIELLESVRKLQAGLQSFLSMRRIEARRKNESAFRLRFSQSLASLRQRLSHAMVRSTIQRLGKTTNPLT